MKKNIYCGWYLLAAFCCTQGSAYASGALGSAPDYAQVLQKSLWFYEVQKSGALPPNNRVSWRGDSAMEDGAAEGVDLTGGWYDAGDHVKFGLPMAESVTLLAWSLVADEAVYVKHGQLGYALDNLRWANDYFIKAHTAPNELWGQVGEGGRDHSFWGAPEGLDVAPNMKRPAFKITPSCPGSDLAGETAAAMAASSMAFRDHDPGYADELLRHARELYQFADQYRGVYNDCIKDAGGFYRSYSGYYDELVWGAAWLYQATKDNTYLAKAETLYDKLSTEQGTSVHSYHWTLSWDDKSYGSYVLLAMLTGKEKYREDAERWLDYWTVGYQGQRIPYTPGGLAYLDQWGALRYAANTAMAALYFGDYLAAHGRTEKAQIYRDFGKRQIDYMLGDNPRASSYVCGYGVNPPQNPHHRGAHGSWSNNLMNPSNTRHILYGALIGGPDQNDSFKDDRGDYVRTEVALDYNAGFTGAVARLAAVYGGSTVSDFPIPEKPDGEYQVTTRINSSGDNYMEIAANLYNHTAWPARVPARLDYRYFVDLSELSAAGVKADDVVITTAYNQATQISKLIPWDKSAQIYYLEVSFINSRLAPVGESESRREVQFRFALPTNMPGVKWNWGNDWSFIPIQGSEAVLNTHIPVYENGKRVWGEEPQQNKLNHPYRD